MDSVSKADIQKKHDQLVATTAQMKEQFVQLQANINANEGAIQMCEMLLSEKEPEKTQKKSGG
jgi:hypothetical protein